MQSYPLTFMCTVPIHMYNSSNNNSKENKVNKKSEGLYGTL